MSGGTGWPSYADATLSGSPKVLGFLHRGATYYHKGYPTLSDDMDLSFDYAQQMADEMPDEILGGVPTVFRLRTGGVSFYFRAFAVGLLTKPARDLTTALARMADGTLSGMPRIAKNGGCYFKIYPDVSPTVVVTGECDITDLPLYVCGSCKTRYLADDRMYLNPECCPKCGRSPEENE